MCSVGGLGRRGEEELAVYSLFGQLMLLDEAGRTECTASVAVTSPLLRTILCLQGQALYNELLQVNSDNS